MSQSEDLIVALEQFYLKFPDFLDNDLYISGESYAGNYVPYLAWQVYQHNLVADYDDSKTSYNLKGYMVGNGITNYTVDVWPAFVDTVYNLHLIPKSLYDDFKANDCYFSFRGAAGETHSLICDELYVKIRTLTNGLNWYDLYGHVYADSAIAAGTLQEENRLGEAMINGELKTYKRGYTFEEYTPWLKDLPGKRILLGDYTSDYANYNDVREALHIPETMPAWEACSSTLQYYPQPEASIWIYKVLQNKYKIMFYSGDTDGALPTAGTRQWIKGLNWDKTEEWKPWLVDGQVAGYIEKYDGLDFVTVHGTGHMAPQWKRKEVTSMITAWIHDEPIESF